jgi:hypothetical protein
LFGIQSNRQVFWECWSSDYVVPGQ